MIDQQRRLYEKRIAVFRRRIESLFYPHAVQFSAHYGSCDPEIDFAGRSSVQMRPIAIGEFWGQDFETGWFVLNAVVPSDWAGQAIYARLNIGGEGLVFDGDGKAIASISMHAVFQPGFVRDRFRLIDSAQGGERVELWIEATANQLFGLHQQPDPDPQDLHRFGYYRAAVQELSLVLFREDIWQLALDFRVLDDLMHSLPEKSVQRARILQACMDAIDGFEESKDGVEQARQKLKIELKKPAAASDLATTAIGHAHLDTAWLWPLRETVRKCGRTFLTQANLLEQHPGYLFGASMPQHYVFCRDRYPDVYKRVKKLVAHGRWEVQGGMWVEADCNLIGGESMVRQILHGKTFFRDEFGVDVRNLWLPDVFGYSAALPQILKKSGIDFLVTQKISWNQFNRFPHHTFIWRGIDGSEIVAHFPPEDTYNSELMPSRLRYAQENFKERAILDEFLTLFGIGDGGGGPTHEIIETGCRANDLEACPRVQFDSAQSMLDRLQDKRDQLKTWVGELYFELHRGTLTTQAFNKKMNRRMELRLRELEILCSALPIADYPQQEFDALWKSLLLYQFHDIIPGSSIAEVYRESREAYAEMEKNADRLLQRAEQAWMNPAKDTLTLVNTLSLTYTRPVLLPPDWQGREVLDETEKVLPVQNLPGGPGVQIKIPELGIRVIHKGALVQTSEKFADVAILENDFVRYELAADGTICRGFDKEAGFEFLTGKGGNVLSLYEDRPTDWDAWEIEIYYENQLLQQAVLSNRRSGTVGPVGSWLQQEFRIGDSEIIQQVVLSDNSKRLDFSTRVHWRERHKMLRVAFETPLQADQATYEIQYGSLKRPTHRNTSWDLARFEAVGHRYADLSERDYGVALLNDCKYGYKILGGMLDFNLLRSATYPDPEADRGLHEFTYSLLPHCGDCADSAVLAEAAQLNQAPLRLQGSSVLERLLPFHLCGQGVVLEAVKKAEKEEALIIRLYEPQGRRRKIELRFAHPEWAIFETSLMEDRDVSLETIDGGVLLEFTPFEIRTLKLIRLV
ncbi:alpha-mannosidase [candidate division KSB1 bacterium]|nr:alpha-mannosidase [candidate division KSB1 bacterium]